MWMWDGWEGMQECLEYGVGGEVSMGNGVCDVGEEGLRGVHCS